jgi:hypothetical protein
MAVTAEDRPAEGSVEEAEAEKGRSRKERQIKSWRIILRCQVDYILRRKGKKRKG